MNQSRSVDEIVVFAPLIDRPLAPFILGDPCRIEITSKDKGLATISSVFGYPIKRQILKIHNRIWIIRFLLFSIIKYSRPQLPFIRDRLSGSLLLRTLIFELSIRRVTWHCCTVSWVCTRVIVIGGLRPVGAKHSNVPGCCA